MDQMIIQVDCLLTVTFLTNPSKKTKSNSRKIIHSHYINTSKPTSFCQLKSHPLQHKKKILLHLQASLILLTNLFNSKFYKINGVHCPLTNFNSSITLL